MEESHNLCSFFLFPLKGEKEDAMTDYEKGKIREEYFEEMYKKDPLNFLRNIFQDVKGGYYSIPAYKLLPYTRPINYGHIIVWGDESKYSRPIFEADISLGYEKTYPHFEIKDNMSHHIIYVGVPKKEAFEVFKANTRWLVDQMEGSIREDAERSFKRVFRIKGLPFIE